MDIILGKWNIKTFKRMSMGWEILVRMGVKIIMELIVVEEIWKIMLIRKKLNNISQYKNYDIISMLIYELFIHCNIIYE
jgi:hypothetical protein